MIKALINITINVIDKDGIDEFIPVLVDFDKRVVTGLSEIPSGLDHRIAVKSWLIGLQIENYGVALRIGDEVGIMTSSKGDKSFVMLARANGSWTVSETKDFFG